MNQSYVGGVREKEMQKRVKVKPEAMVELLVFSLYSTSTKLNFGCDRKKIFFHFFFKICNAWM